MTLESNVQQLKDVKARLERNVLRNFVSVYVPSTRKGTEALTEAEHLEWVKEVASEFSAQFGGATATPGTGYWLSDVAGLVAERVTIVTSYFGDDIKPEYALQVATQVAEYIKYILEQEAVSVQTPEGLEFI